MNITKVEVRLNNDTIKNVEIEDYDAKQIEKELNDPDKNMIALGDIVVQRFSVVRVVPVELLNDTEED